MHNPNFRRTGEVLDVVAPYDRASSGLGVKIGALFGVTLSAVDLGDDVRIERTGVHDIAKTSAQAWAVGDRIFWDDTNKRCDTDSTVGMFIGVATEVAANPSSEGRVLLAPPPMLLEGKQAAVADVATADADATYGSPEATLINELKTQLNSLLAKLRIQGLIT